jgi:hypothetical protein
MLPYSVVRDGQALEVAVPLVHWRFGWWLAATLGSPLALLGQLSGFGLLAIASLVFWQRPRNPAARQFLLLNAALTTVNNVTGTLPSAWPELIDPRATVLAGALAQGVLFGVLLPAILLHFAVVFPRPKPLVRRRPWLAWIPAGVGLVVFGLAPGSSLGWFWFLAALLLMLALLAHSAITMRDAVSRAQLTWGLGGLMAGFGILAFMLLAGTFNWIPGLNQNNFDLASLLAFGLINLSLAVAITRYRLFDIDVIIRRTLIYSALSVVLALTYFGSVVVLESVFRVLTGESQNTLGVVLSTLAIAALFGPLRARVQAWIDRRFYRQKYDARRALTDFAANARDETDLARLTGQLVAVVQTTMQPEHVGVWLAARSDSHRSDPKGFAETLTVSARRHP